MNLRKWILLSVLFSTLIGCGGPYNSGDRVLVAKPSYDNGFTGANRYDVVVFKYPRGPVEKNTPKNYIKRLLGLPGEIIAIFFGRLHRLAPEKDAPPFYDDLKDGLVADPNDLWTRTHMDDDKSKRRFEAGEFSILRKPPHVMLALRRIVYDNDFQAKDLKGKLDRWNPAPNGTWSADQATGFVNSGQALDKVSWLRYEHLLCPEDLRESKDPREKEKINTTNVKKMLILDTLDYNTFQSKQTGNNAFLEDIYASAHWVGDLMLECNVEATEAKGEFWLELSKGVDRFRARFDLASGQCTLFRVGMKDQVKEMDARPTRVKGPGKYLVRFANIDARLTVWVDRDLPFGDGKEYDPPEVRARDEKITDAALLERRGPIPENDLEPASIGSKGASVKITNLKLWRDIYYRTRIQFGNMPAVDFDGAMKRADWADPANWGMLRNLRSTTMYVQPGHYLCLGDNSQASSDSRDWGLVPERLMLGRALMVYYPLDRIGPIR
jgi:signal peptidase I